jgi:hypothetical protein
MDRRDVFHDVTTAVAKVVFNIPSNDWATFDEDLVPEKGMESSVAAWGTTLDDIEGVLHGMDKRYRGLDLTEKDAKALVKVSILDNCIAITDKIMKLPAVPERVAELMKRAKIT